LNKHVLKSVHGKVQFLFPGNPTIDSIYILLKKNILAKEDEENVNNKRKSKKNITKSESKRKEEVELT